MPTGAAVGQVVAPEGARKKTFRPDIQGLRMIAVVAVILDHLIFWPVGGFVGVDVFFVISGFLITSLLLREHDRTGTISFVGFYRRRVKRIVPAATVVIVCTIAAGYFLFNTFRANQVVWDGVWATFFSANWHFALVGTDYFQADGPVSPLQHFWSLSVEEQFYFVWPWLMLGIFAVLARFGLQRHGRRLVLLTILLISVASFGWSLYETATSPTWSYFSTFSRAWELGVGATIAVTATWWGRIPSALRPALGWVGLAGIGASLFVISDEVAFPAPWAALPVLATAVVIIAGTGGRQRFLWPIMNPVSSYAGDISYSLYLWHFPIIIFLAPFFPSGSIIFYVICVAAMVALSILSYHFIENKVRDSKWLEPRPKSRFRRSRRSDLHPAYGYAGVGAIAVGTVLLCVAALLPRPIPINDRAYGSESAPEPTQAAVTPADAASALQGDVSAAAEADSWPQFDPPIDNLADQRVPQWTENGCLDVSATNIDLCVYGQQESERTAVVLGDSIATSWLPAIIGALEPMGYRVQALTKQGCPIARTQVFPSGNSSNIYTECERHQEWAAEQVQRLQPSLIVMSDSFLSIARLASGNEGQAAQDEWEEAYSAALSALPAAASKVSLMAPPGAQNLQECYTPVSNPSDCMRPIADDWEILREAEERALSRTDGTFVDTRDWFCDGERCPSFVGTAAVYADSGHLTAAYSSRLAPVVSQALVDAGVPVQP